MSSRRPPLSWSEHPLRELIRLSWPICVSLLSFGVMTLVGSLFVSRLGTAPFAGVGLAGTAAFAVLCFPMGLLRGVKVLVSQAVGASKRDELGSHLGAGLATGLVLGVITAALSPLVALVLPLVAPSAASGVAAADYFRVRMLGAPIILLFVALREHRYGEGDSRSPMIASLVGNAVNIVFNWLFVIELGKGVTGSALATVIGNGVELAILFAAQRAAEGFPIWNTSMRHVAALVRTGAPTGTQFLLEMGSFTMLTLIVSSMGDLQMAAHNLVLQVIHFSFLPTVALGEAGSVMAGQAVGAKRDELVVPLARQATIASTVYTGAFTVLMLVAGAPIVSLFNPTPALALVALGLLRVSACFQVADGAATVVRGVLRGTGDVRVPARLGIVCAWMCTPPLAWFLGRVLGLGALGGWIGLCLEITVLAVLCWRRLTRGGWRPLAEASRERLRETAFAEAAA